MTTPTQSARKEDLLTPYLKDRGFRKSFGEEVLRRREMLEMIATRASMPPERTTVRDEVCCEGSTEGVQARLEHLYDLLEATDDEKREHFLAQYQLDQEQVVNILSTPQRQGGPLPNWIGVLEEVVEQGVSNSLAMEDCSLQIEDPLPFEEILLPFLWYGRRLYEQRMAQVPSLLVEGTQIMLERRLLRQLCRLAQETLLLEFTLFRKQQGGERFSGRSRKLYELFVAQYRGDGLLSLFQEYSVLARLLVLKVEQWVDSCTEFERRLVEDMKEIEQILHEGETAGKVVKIQPGCSDAHHHGRSVFLVSFANGLKVAYKPRNLGVDLAFADLLRWGNEHGLAPSLRGVRVINRETHGWAEYVTQCSCSSEEEVRAYYQKAGLLLCWLYLLGGNDMHRENLIASGPNPIVIDLETIITAGFPSCLWYKDPWERTTTADDLLYQKHSVLTTGLLPGLRRHERADMENVAIIHDDSGLGGVRGHLETRSEYIWKYINTDAMYKEVIQQTGEMTLNTVLLQDQAVDPVVYYEDVIQGFQKGYRFLLAHRQELLAADGPLVAFQDCHLRFVRRATAVYAKGLEILQNPRFLREGTDRWIELQVFATRLPERQMPMALWKVAQSEIEALQRLDIPRFITRASSHDLWLETGEKLPQVFSGTALEQVTACLQQLDEAEMARQVHLIRTAFLLAQQTEGMEEKAPPPHLNGQVGDELLSKAGARLHSFVLQPYAPVPSAERAVADGGVTERELIEAAHSIAQELQAHAYRDQFSHNYGTWIGLYYEDTLKGHEQEFVGFNLYQGACGIALFLAALHKVTGERTACDLIISALQPLCRNLKDAVSSLAVTTSGTWEIGGTSGLGSYIYALTRIGVWLDQPELLEGAWNATYLLTKERVRADQTFDVMGGSAGALLGLLTLYRYVQKEELLQQALWCGYHLLEQRVETASGYRVWPAFQLHPLTGFSHGAAGIAYALLRLAEVTGDQIWKETAEEALGFEQSLFLPEEGNWLDLRELSDETGIYGSHAKMVAWCHGATGIGLARLGGLATLGTSQVRTDLELALEKTQQTGLQELDALCCGNSGRIELLVAASQRLKRGDLLEEAQRWCSEMVRRSEEQRGFCVLPRLPRWAYNPGLFQGTAGIGYEMLRVACPDQVPSVLLWE